LHSKNNTAQFRQKQSKTKAVLITENLKEYSCFKHHIIMLNLVHHHFQAFPKGPSQSLPDQQLLYQALGRQGLSPRVWLWVNQRSTEKSTIIAPSLFQTPNFSKMQKSLEIT